MMKRHDMTPKGRRVRRSLKTRKRIAELDVVRLCVHRSPRHIYAQLIRRNEERGDEIIASASTLEKSMREELKVTGNKLAAALVGKRIAERALAAGVKNVAFDRSGLKYHGRVKALADAAREAGIQF